MFNQCISVCNFCFIDALQAESGSTKILEGELLGIVRTAF